VKVSLDTGNLLREAAQRMPLNYVSLRFRNPHELISRAGEASTVSNFLPTESFILSRLDAPTQLAELVAVSGLRELDAHRIIYGLALSGSVRREYWHNAFRTEAEKTIPDQPVAGAPSPKTPASPREPADNRWALANDENEVEVFLDRVSRASNYYEIMDLPPTSADNEIKEAYYALARRYHPDRFHLKSGTSLHARISSAFAKVTQAYEALTDPDSRSAYDVAMERSRQFAESAPKAMEHSVAGSADEFEFERGGLDTELGEAEHNFREGFGALRQGQINVAMTRLATAARMSPHEPRYRAYYGRALAADEKTRRLAEGELQAAVKLEPSNALYRTMLAELYFDLRFHRRAQTELDRALALDPKNTRARALLRKLKKSHKAG
jgi:curved DNA-binding protein CbpA